VSYREDHKEADPPAESKPVTKDEQEQEQDHEHEHEHDDDEEDDDEGDEEDDASREGESEDESADKLPLAWELASLTPEEQETFLPPLGTYPGGKNKIGIFLPFDHFCEVTKDPGLLAMMHYRIGERAHCPFDMWTVHDVAAAGWSARRNTAISWIAQRYGMYLQWASVAIVPATPVASRAESVRSQTPVQAQAQVQVQEAGQVEAVLEATAQ